MERTRLTIASVNRATLTTLRLLRPIDLVALIVATIVTNLIDFVLFTSSTDAITGSGRTHVKLLVIAGIFRVLAVFWVSYAVQRRLVGGAQVYRPGMPLVRFVGVQILIVVGSMAVRWPLDKASPAHAALATEWLVNFVGATLWAVLAVRLLACVAGTAAGASFAALPGLWRGLAGRDVVLIGAMVGLVVPIVAIHLGFTLAVLRVPMSMDAKTILAIVDGLVSALQLALLSGLGAVALRLAGPIEAQPLPR